MNRPKIKIEVVSDVVCPWCYIGKRRLEKALDRLKGQFEFEVEYSPFELNPDMPIEGRNQREYLVDKFGSESKYVQMTDHVTSIAADEGLTFNFQAQHFSPNTKDAHRLIWLAKTKGKQVAMKEALMSAYFEKGIDLTKKENLVQLATLNGLEHDDVLALLNSDEGLGEVLFAEKVNHQRGVRGVPFYIINDKYGISGAQPTLAFVEALTSIGGEMTKGEACDVDQANCQATS